MKVFASGFIVFIALFAFSCGGSDNTSNAVVVNSANTTNASTPVAAPRPSGTLDELASGRKVYETSCQNCHKPDGTGGPVEIEGKKIDVDDLTSAKIKGFSDEKILGYIVNGIEDEGMPAFKGKLSEGEMRQVVKFIRVELQGLPMENPPTVNRPTAAAPATNSPANNASPPR